MSETPPPEPADTPAAPAGDRLPAWLLPSLALGLAVGSVALPVLALPALIVVILVAARSAGRTRLLVGALGTVAAMAGLLRFTLEWAVPNIVSSGQFAAEERAVSRLREILWSEDRVREQRWIDTDGDRQGEYAFLGELADKGRPRPGAKAFVPMLRPAQFHALSAGGVAVYRSEGYVFTVYLPGPGGAAVAEPGPDAAVSANSPVSVDGKAASRFWVAYAWPAERGRGGQRAFYIDQDDRICQTDNAQGYSGSDKIPAANAALSTTPGAPPCSAESNDGGAWRPWKKKKPRGAPAADGAPPR